MIRAYGQQCKYLRTLPLHHSQEELSHTDDYTDFQYRLCITDDLVRELVAKGNTIQVLQPEELKQQVLNSALGIINRYKE